MMVAAAAELYTRQGFPQLQPEFAMSLSNGRHYLAIPGPSVFPDNVLQAMHRPGPNIYAPALAGLMASIQTDLKKVVRTSHHAAMYIANGHGVWEAALANVLSPGDKVLVLATGRFGHGWAVMAKSLGIETDVIDFGLRSTIDPEQVRQALQADHDHQYQAVLAVHVDTATSVRNDIKALRDTIDSTGHNALLMIDCIASLGCDVFEMDQWGVDLVVAACQKGLMTPPGLGFVFYNPKAAGYRDRQSLVSNYWDWNKRAAPDEFYQYFCGTPPTHLLYGLREALDMILAEGIESVWRRHEILATAICTAFDVWAGDGPLELNITEPALRSHAVTAVRVGAPDGTRIRDWVLEHAGVTLGIGLGMAEPDDPAWHGFFRYGHMGHINSQMVMGGLGSIDAALKALNIPHGKGALDAASAYLAANAIS